MRIKTISFISAIFFSMNLYSQDVNSTKKIRLLIYNFITTDNYESSDLKDKYKNFQYYSIVIPETISKSLNNNGTYDILREAGPFSIDSDFGDAKERTKYIKKIGKLGLHNKADYIITGNFNIVNNKLHVRVTIFDVTGKVIEVVDHESAETGVKFQGTIDTITSLINDNIARLNIINVEKSNRSPFIALYNSLSIVTLGVDSGYIYMLGNWSSLFNNSLYFSPFIDFDLIENFSLSIKLTSIQSDSDGKNSSLYSQIRLLSGSMNFCYLYPISNDFGIAASAGAGMTKTTITIQPSDPFNNALSEKVSFDPNIDISTYFVYNLSLFHLRAGIMYKRIFLKNEPMNTAIIFAGAGIQF